MYLINVWHGDRTVIHKATCSHNQYPDSSYKRGPFGLQMAIDEAQKRGLPIRLCKWCFGAEIEGTTE